MKSVCCQIVLVVMLLMCAAHSFADTTLSYVYDANGNLINGDGKYYEYNDANQLVKVRHGDQSGPVLAEYVYDYTGQRIKKVENGVTTYYVGKHYETNVSGSGTTNTSYYFANGERVAKKDPSGNMYYYHSDHLGGTNAVTDASGNFVERTKYYPFGEIREGGNEKYLYTGKEKDRLTDWYYYEARYYNPDFKHFTQADTILPKLYDPQDLNRYAYVRNNPVKLVDPSGQSAKTVYEKIKRFDAQLRSELLIAKKIAQSKEGQRRFIQGLKEGGIQSLEVLSGLGDMSLSILKHDPSGLILAAGDTSLAFIRFGIDKNAPKSISETPGYLLDSPTLVKAGKSFDTIYSFKNFVKSGGDLRDSIRASNLIGIPLKDMNRINAMDFIKSGLNLYQDITE